MTCKTAIEIRDAIESGKTTAEEVVIDTLEKIKEHDTEIGAFLETFDDDALDAARRVDKMKQAGEPLGRLAGVPIAVKDVILVKGQIASASSKMLEHHRAAYDATVIERLKAAGAIIIGRTNCDEFAMGVTTETSFWQKTYNPYDTERTPGGSSGGSAAAVAAGFVPVALATDTGGSIRQPAGFCNVVGLKPSYGRVSRYGSIALCSSFDQIGPITHTAEDAALVLEVMGGKDEMDATTEDVPNVVVPELLEKSFKGMRVGLPKEYLVDEVSEDVKKIIQETKQLIEKEGGEVIEVSLPLTEYAIPAYYIILPAEASSNLARYDGMRYGTRAETTLLDSYLKSRGEGFGDEVKRRIMIGTYILSAGYYDAYYKKALQVRQAIHAEFNTVFEAVDVLLTPTSPGVPWNIGEISDPISLYLADIFTCPANIAGICGISIPGGFSDGLPVGIQFLGKAFDENKILQAAAAYQSLTDWHTKKPS